VVLSITCGPGDVYEGVGVVVAKSAEVLSAAHVGSHCLDVKKAVVGTIRSPYAAPGNDLTATLQHRIADNRTTFEREAVEKNEFQDLALWKIDTLEGSGLVPAPIAKAFPIAGDPIEIVGFAGLPFSHTINGEAGKHRGTGVTRYRTWITSVAASAERNIPYRIHYPGFTLPGLSGGPVFNAAGQLLGIHSSRYSKPVDNALAAGCGTGKPNCFGLDVVALKTMLDNYSWATSVFAIPADWLP